MSNPGRWRRLLRWILIAVPCVTVGGFIGGWLLVEDSTRRFYTYGPYGNALWHYYETFNTPAPDIETLERAYMATERPLGLLPPGKPYGRPAYRSPAGLPKADYLVVVEPVSYWYQLTRHLWYVSSAGKPARLDVVWRWEARSRISEDDRLRATVAVQTQPMTRPHP